MRTLLLLCLFFLGCVSGFGEPLLYFSGSPRPSRTRIDYSEPDISTLRLRAIGRDLIIQSGTDAGDLHLGSFDEDTREADVNIYLNGPMLLPSLEGVEDPPGSILACYSSENLGAFECKNNNGSKFRPGPVDSVETSALSYLVEVDVQWVYTDTSSNDVTVNGYNCNSGSDGLIIEIRELDSTNDTIFDPQGMQLVDGALTFSFDANSVSGLSVRCKGTGSNVGWWSF